MTGKFAVPFLLSALAMIVAVIDALPTSMERMTVSRTRMADLESSATGYVYNSQRGGQPRSYVRYTNHGTGGYYDAPAPIQYVTYRKPAEILHPGPTLIDALPGYARDAVAAYPPGYVVPVLEAPKKTPLAPYYVAAEGPQKSGHVEIVDEEDHEGHEGRADDHDSDDEDDSSEEDESEEEDDEDEEEARGGGEESHSEEESSRGEKGDEGYKSRHSFDDGEKGEHQRDRHEGHYSEDEDQKKGHLTAAGTYDERDEADESVEGESHGQKSYHNKGQKTTGYHNVYKKDEYKKDTDFYDDDHKSGHRESHSSSKGRHSAAQGGHAKGERHESSHEERAKGSEGHRDKGHERSEHSGHKSSEGTDSYHNNHADYATRGATVGGEKYGYDGGRK